MLPKIIEFEAAKSYVDLKLDLPKPIKLNIPKWYKHLEHSADFPTIKGCIPFLDTMTTGYSLSLPQDFILKHNVLEEGEVKSYMIPSKEDRFETFDINLNTRPTEQIHHIKQVEGSPFVKKNLEFPVQKILNPWVIKTPPGYSCLFVSPLNNADDRFSIIPGIVNTDTFKVEINFPFIVNGDKYPVLDTILKRGTPYVQVIPFKRDSWKMKIKEVSETKKNKSESFYFKHTIDLIHRYKTKWWNKSSFS